MKITIEFDDQFTDEIKDNIYSLFQNKIISTIEKMDFNTKEFSNFVMKQCMEAMKEDYSNEYFMTEKTREKISETFGEIIIDIIKGRK